jgi:hypothetical protein
LGYTADGIVTTRLPALLAVLLLSIGACTLAAAAEQPVVSGPGNDYQAAVIRPWGQPQRRIAVFERLDGAFSGDLWLTTSQDDGETWGTPVPAIASAANERHASLVQTGPEAFLLLYLSNASGGFRIHRATSADGSAFVEQGAIDLGWATAGEINPQVIREPDGTLNLVYHRLGGAAYLARSPDGGVNWDPHRTQVSPGNAALPRLARRSGDGRYLLFYQTGAATVSLWAKTTGDPYDWSAPAVQLVADGNNHDAWPLATSDGRFAVFWARVVGGAFQIHASHSSDGGSWTAPVALSDRPGLKNIQPHALAREIGGQVELYWGAAQVAGDGNYDIVRLPAVQLFQPEADLSLEGAALESPVACGAAVGAGFLLRNDGPAAVPVAVQFDREGPSGLDAVEGPGGWSCDADGTSRQCSVDAMAAGAEAVFEVLAGSTPDDCGGVVALSATAGSALGLDPVPGNDTATVPVAVLPPTADLQLSVEASAAGIDCLATARADFLLLNAGPGVAVHPVLALSVDGEGTDAVQAPPDWDCAAIDGTWSCAGPDMAAGADAAFRLDVATNAQDCGSVLTLAGSVASASADPNGADNTAAVQVAVAPAPPAGAQVFEDGFEPR